MTGGRIETLHFVGKHGAGKTELANWLWREKNIPFLDTGPLVRLAHSTRSESLVALDVGSFAHFMEAEDVYYFYDRFSDRLKALTVDTGMAIIVGMRSFGGIRDLELVCPEVRSHIVWIDADNDDTLRERVNDREGKQLLTDQFAEKLHADESMGLLEIRARATHYIANPASQPKEGLYQQGARIVEEIRRR